MQLFSRNKAFVALSLGALTALGACGDDVTVPVAPAAPVTISITPPSATMNVGETLNFAVSIAGGNPSPTLASCSSSNAAVATASVSGSACSVRAVAPGNATITAASSSGQAAAAGVSVAAPAAAISGLAVSPAASQLSIGGSVTLVPTVNRAGSSVNVTYTYTSSSTAIATVTSAGVVTAVAPGTATITISAAGTGAGFSNATLTTAAAIVVADRTPSLTALQVQPASVSLTIGGTQAISASASGPRASSATYTYTSATPAVATVTSTGTITAVAPGTATIKVIATATESGAFAASTLEGLVTVTVSERTPGLTALQVAPSTASMTVGGSLAITHTLSGPRKDAATITYGSSAPSVASVDAAGKVTALAPGSAVITVTAASAESGAFGATSITGLVNITVAERTAGLTALQVSPTTASLQVGGTQQLSAVAAGPQASAATISFTSRAAAIATVTNEGVVTAVAPGTAVIEVKATSAETGAFAASSLSSLVTVTVVAKPVAQVSIASVTERGGNAVDVNDTKNQIMVNSSLTTNGVTVSSVQAYVCAVGATCPAANQAPAAQQTFSGSAATSTVALAINTADFSVNSDWSSATTRYSNGLNVIAVTITTPEGETRAANTVQLNFTNTDGVAIRHTAPSRSAADASGRVYYGGPGAEGRGQATIVPVMYTAGRTLRTARLNIAQCGTGFTFNSGTDTAPWTVSYGATQTVDANGVPTAMGLGCAYATPTATAANVVPTVANATDNNGVAVTGLAAAGAVTAPASIAVDYVAPTITTLQVAGGGATGAEFGWVNGAYRFDERDANGNPLRYVADDNNGVGLRATRDTRFSVCNTPDVVTGLTAAVSCATPVASGGLTSTVSSMSLGENASNLTNQAYFLVASETDRLGNSVTSNPFTYTDNSGAAPVVVPATSSLITFGVDVTAPVILTIPAPATTEPVDQPSLANFARTSIDSIFTNGSNTHFGTTIATDGAISASNALFAVRVRDARSGFVACQAGTCPTVPSRANIGTFQIERRRSNVPAGTSAPSNSAIVENIIDVPTTLAPTVVANVMDAATLGTDPSIRQFSINIFGAASRYPSASILPAAFSPAASVSGYYQFSGTVRDRAGNTATITPRRVVIDNGTPAVASIGLPSTLTGGTQPTFTINGSDDLEVTGAELALTYPSIAIRFPRVTNFAATARTGIYAAPFSAFTTGLLGAVTGSGASSSTFSGNVTLPAPFIQDLQVLASSAAAPASGAFSAAKPTSVTGTLFDIKSMVSLSGTSTSITSWSNTSASATQPILGYNVSANTVVKQWGADYTDPTTSVVTVGAKVAQWFIYTATTSSVEFRSSSTSSTSSVPFSGVRVVTRRYQSTTGDYESSYIDRGVATYVGTVDEGGTRYHRWTWTPGAAVSQGNNVSTAAFTDGDSVRAIGLDAQGNGLMTAAGATGTTAFGRIISSIAQGNVNVFKETATSNASPLTISTIYADNSLTTRSFAATPVVSAVNVSGDSRIFIGAPAGGGTATARIYFPLTLAAGVTATTSANTTVTCTSSNDGIVEVVARGVAAPLSSANTASTALQPFCDIRGNLAGSFATLTVTAARVGTGTPYGDATAANTFTTSSQIYVGSPTLTTLGAAGALSAFATTPTSGTSSIATFTIAAPTFAGAFTAATTTMSYTINNAGSDAATGVSTAVAVNALDGSAVVTVTCSSAARTALRPFAFHIMGRAVSTVGYANPLASGTGTGSPAVTGTCN